jgi:hypothetical protein
MIYGDLRSSYSPQGREYVTRWNPQTVPLVSSGSPLAGLGGSQSPLAAALLGAPVGAIGGGLPGTGTGYGGKLGAIGSALGLATGTPLGAVGNAIGTGFDVRNANNALDTTRQANSHLTAPSLGLGAYASGFLNNATFGMLGTPVGDSMIESAVTGVSMPGVPNQAPEPDAIAAAQAGGGGGGGYSDNGGGSGFDGGAGGYGAGGSDGPGGGFGGEGNGGNAWAKGGHVTKDRLIGPDPIGPDDGYGQLDHGEYVVKASDVKRLGGPNATRKKLAELLARK